MSDVQNLKNAPGISTNNQKPAWSSIITFISIVVVLIIGALYVWGKRISEERESPSYPAGESTPSRP